MPLPGAGGMYEGAQKSWDNLLKFEAEDNHEELSLLHVCVSYCGEHEEENNSLLGLEVPSPDKTDAHPKPLKTCPCFWID